MELARARPQALTPSAVLGLQRLAGNAATAAAVGALVVQRKVVCVPKAVDRATYLAEGGPKNSFGLTELSNAALVGSRRIQPVVAHPKLPNRFVVSAKVPTLGTIKSIYNKPERISAADGPDVPFVNVQPSPCVDKHIPLPWQVTADGSAKIAAAEKHHCNDFEHAWNITLGRFSRAARSLRGRVFRSTTVAEDAVGRKAGIEVKAWGDKFQTVAAKSAMRDDTATKAEHVPQIPPKDVIAPNRNPKRCLRGLFYVTKAAFPVTPRKTKDLITW